MILREQQNVFLFEFGLMVPTVLKCLFRRNCADVVYHLEKSYLYSLIFAPIKDFLDICDVEHPGHNVKYLKTSKILKVSSQF